MNLLATMQVSTFSWQPYKYGRIPLTSPQHINNPCVNKSLWSNLTCSLSSPFYFVSFYKSLIFLLIPSMHYVMKEIWHLHFHTALFLRNARSEQMCVEFPDAFDKYTVLISRELIGNKCVILMQRVGIPLPILSTIPKMPTPLPSHLFIYSGPDY